MIVLKTEQIEILLKWLYIHLHILRKKVKERESDTKCKLNNSLKMPCRLNCVEVQIDDQYFHN